VLERLSPKLKNWSATQRAMLVLLVGSAAVLAEELFRLEFVRHGWVYIRTYDPYCKYFYDPSLEIGGCMASGKPLQHELVWNGDLLFRSIPFVVGLTVFIISICAIFFYPIGVRTIHWIRTGE
jgi:hypothetical protein